MRTLPLLFSVYLFAVLPVFAADDPITRISNQLSKNPMWDNGVFIPIKLPKSAKPVAILNQFFKNVSAPRGYITDFDIEEIRQLKISNSDASPYTAALVSSDQGGQIVIFRYMTDEDCWWARMYGARYTYDTK